MDKSNKNEAVHQIVTFSISFLNFTQFYIILFVLNRVMNKIFYFRVGNRIRGFYGSEMLWNPKTH